MKFRIDWKTALAGAAVGAAFAAAFLSMRRKPREDDELERQRRLHLNQIGRIAEGRVIEVVETRPEEKAPSSKRSRAKSPAVTDGKRTLVCYAYSISGVSYETAQDVTGLEERACLERVAAGQPASIKYDPANPSNSILIADDWSGLH